MNNQVKVAVNVVLIRENKLLLGKRKKVGEGDWGLSGGHLEFGEKIIEGASRELKEETGIETDLVFLNCVNDPLDSDGTHYIHFQFLGKDNGVEPKLMESDKCHEWSWFSLDNLPENIFIGHRKVISFLMNGDILVD